MVQALRRFFQGPYAETLSEIDKLATLDRGWNGYRAGRITEEARRRAKSFVQSLSNIPREVPPPSVAPTPNGGVLLHWYAGSKEVEITFLASGGEYSVSRRGKEDVIDAGPVEAIDLLKDIVQQHVVAR